MKTRPWHNFSTKNGPKKSEQITCLITTLLTLLRIPFLGRIGSISYVLPIRQNIDILNRDIRVGIFLLYSCSLSFCIKRKELCALQAIFSSPLNDTAKKGTNKVRKARIYSILMTVLTLIFLVFYFLFVYLPLIKLLTTNASIVLTIIIAFLDAMFNLCGFSITINTVILYIPAIDL